MRHETRILNYLEETRPKGDYKTSEIRVEVTCYVLPLKWGIPECLCETPENPNFRGRVEL